MSNDQLTKFMQLDYTIVLRRDEEGDWIAAYKELDGCIAHGLTIEESITALNGMKELWLAANLEAGNPIPLPEKEQTLLSGKWVQRVPKNMHRRLVEVADCEGTSLNQLVTSFLAESLGRLNAAPSTVAAHNQNAEIVPNIFGEDQSSSFWHLDDGAAKITQWKIGKMHPVSHDFIEQLVCLVPSPNTKLIISSENQHDDTKKEHGVKIPKISYQA